MNETDSLAILRSSVARLSEDEKLALAAFLGLDCTVHISSPILGEETHLFPDNLKETLSVVTEFPRTAKLAFAIELLQAQLDEEDGDGLADPSDYEGEEYYSIVELDPYGYDTPAIDEEGEDY
jgi:hypothetical protein